MANVIQKSGSESDLQIALNLHKSGQLKEALQFYEKVLKQAKPSRVAFLNTPPLLRSLNRHAEAIQVSKQGLGFFPFDQGIYNNMGNCYLDNDDDFNAISCYRRALSIDPTFNDPRSSLLTLLIKNKFIQLAYVTALAGMRLAETPDKFIVPFLESYYRLPEDQRGSIDDFQKIVDHLEAQISTEDGDVSSIQSVMAQLWLQVGDLEKASRALSSLRNSIAETIGTGHRIKQSFVSRWNSLNWNLSILLLKSGRLKDGWSLFDYGLRVKADGPQRWQRALKKPFGSTSIPLWRGESLKGKHILLLGEQGIGDTMMFATLIPKILDRGAKISFYPGDRLTNIYKESFDNVDIISSADLKANLYDPKSFDYQSPLGSICQYGFDDVSDYGNPKPILKSNTELSSKLRSKYHDNKPIIGISWQGGGKPNRIKKKSCELYDLLPILKRTDLTFVSLQYGNDGPVIEKFNKKHGLSIIHDDSIDPIKDMYSWLAQVRAMDLVISIANTTVHGSGGLGIPTCCLVSTESDWRWINPEIYASNYWYHSVDTVYQSSDGKWYDAINNLSLWLNRQLTK